MEEPAVTKADHLGKVADDPTRSEAIARLKRLERLEPDLMIEP
jgi:hypothetical protein